MSKEASKKQIIIWNDDLQAQVKAEQSISAKLRHENSQFELRLSTAHDDKRDLKRRLMGSSRKVGSLILTIKTILERNEEISEELHLED